jgi:hypothetical protein
MEAKPVNNNSSTLFYTLVYDLSNFPDETAKNADIARRRAQFDTLLLNIKTMAEEPTN